MPTTFHILNGDALLEQFPSSLSGELIVARECLVDGDVTGATLDAFFETRARFISTSYPQFSKADYFTKTVSELLKIQQLPEHSSVYLWFEHDLFCQVNMWFVCSLLQNKFHDVYFVQPTTSINYGFGGMNSAQLESAFHQAIKLTNQQNLLFSQLWVAYQNSDFSLLQSLAEQLQTVFTFLPETVSAHIQRFPENGTLGRPEKTIQNIMNELDTKEFSVIFSEFWKREAIYGFGDLQVMRLFEKLTSGD